SACPAYPARENKTGTSGRASPPEDARNRAHSMEHFPDIVAVMVGVSVEGPYSYRVARGMEVRRGSIVAVPLVGRLTLGVVWGPPAAMVAHNRLKDIEHAYDVPPLSEERRQTIDWVARCTLAAPGRVLRSVLRSTEALDREGPVTAY